MTTPTWYSKGQVDGLLAGKPNTTSLAPVATSGNYTDLTGRPTLATVSSTGAYSDLTGKPTLATVATTGAYTDLTGRPTLATVATSGSYTDLSSKPTIPSQFTDLSGTITMAQLVPGATITVTKDPVTGFWPASYTAAGAPIYTGGSASAGVRPTSRTDVVVDWKGPDPSPGIVSSGTGGMITGVDKRSITP